MFLTVLIIPIAFRAEPELHFRTVHFRPGADRAFMFGDAAAAPDIPFKLLPPVYLLRIQMHHVS